MVTPTNYKIDTERLGHLSTSCIPNSSHVRTEGETDNREEITYITDVMAAGTGRTIVASETKSATDVGSRATSGPCVGLVTKTNTTRKAKS